MNKQDLRNLKYNRSKPEDRFLYDIFNGLVKEESLKYKGDILYMKDNYYYFYHNTKNGWFYYDYDKIYSVFVTKFGYNYHQTNEFIKSRVEEHLKLKGITTPPTMQYFCCSVEEHLKLKDITTDYWKLPK